MFPRTDIASRVLARPYGFRFLLLLEDGEAADPAAFLTAIPTWHAGDARLADHQGRCGPSRMSRSGSEPPPPGSHAAVTS